MEAKEKLMHILMLVAAGEYMGELNWSKQADKIIEAFPQIEKKPVRLHPTQFNVAHSQRYGFEQLDRFRSDEERQAWIERHYCEVLE